jgi:transposase
MYIILKTYTGLTNKAVREIFGVSISAVNKAAIRINAQCKTSKNFRRELEEITCSAFKV